MSGAAGDELGRVIGLRAGMNRPYLIVSGSLFGLVALLHLLRLVYGWAVPEAASAIGMIVAAGLYAWAFRWTGNSAVAGFRSVNCFSATLPIVPEPPNQETGHEDHSHQSHVSP
jgi:hypothetical protein